MKQYTTQEQTAKLIELGFERPKSMAEYDLPAGDWRIGSVGIRKAYSIGELIEMLPRYIEDKGATIDIGFDMFSWVIAYLNIPQEYVYCTSGLELIDALYEMIIKLKEEKLL